MQAAPRPTSSRPVSTRGSTAGSIAQIVFALLAALGLLAAVGVVAGYLALSRNLADPKTLTDFKLAEESVIYDRSGQQTPEHELARFGALRREIVTLDELPPILVDATTAVEDKSFWTNPGFDPAAIISAGLDALRGSARGASTITQQLVRQRLLDSDLVQSKGRTPERKLKEIIQSIRLTQTFSGEDGKQGIITAYLNQNYYGNNSYGVKAAARSYFGKELKDLTLGEVALIAALPQSPSNYDLVRNATEEDDGTLVVPPDTDIVRRRNLVLDLLAQGRTPLSGDSYSAADFEAAKSERVVLAPQVDEPWKAPHFVWAVREELTRTICGEEAETCPELEQGGFRITTTLDLRIQGIAEKWVKAAAVVPKAKNPRKAATDLGLTYEPWMANLRNKDVNNGALVAVDYQTGELIAYVGSADYTAKKGSAKFQPKFDVAGKGYRQPGSAFKPFNYLVGIDDKRFTAATMFMDAATDFGGGYTPSDSDNLERGPVRVRNALQFSLNIPSVKAAAVNKPEHVYARAQDFGMRFRSQTLDAGLSVALGVEEVRPVDLVTAYATLANQGRYIGHTTILRIQRPDGADVVPPYEPPAGEQVASPEAAAIVGDILAGNTNPQVNPFWGTFRIRDADGQRRPAALKTGTNNDAKDLNAYGFIGAPTAEGRKAGEFALAVGAWNGNSDNSVVSTPQKPVFSVDVTTYVWQGFLQEATSKWERRALPRPDSLRTVEVDPFTGLRPAPGEKGVPELFIAGTEPKAFAGANGGVCGEAILEAAGFETRFQNWLEADRDWIARAKRGPGTRGGPEGTRTTYFYNSSFNPYGRTWGAIVGGGPCGTPEPAPSCFPLPSPDASGVIPSFEIPSPKGSGPAPEPCPTPSTAPSASPSPSLTEPPPSEPPATEPPATPPPPTPEPTPEPTAPPAPSASAGAAGATPKPVSSAAP